MSWEDLKKGFRILRPGKVGLSKLLISNDGREDTTLSGMSWISTLRCFQMLSVRSGAVRAAKVCAYIVNPDASERVAR